MPKVHLVQFDIAWESPEANRETVRTLLDRAEVAPGDFVLLPEMFDTGFSFNIETTSDMRGETLVFLSELAQDLKVCVQGGRTVAPCHRCTGRNVMTALAPGEREAKLLCEYAKIHPFGGEGERIEGGREVLTYRWEGAGLTVCPAICYDLRFPEVFRAGLKKGAEMYAVGACWPAVRKEHWRTLLIARAIENQAFVLGCNRVGKDPGPPAAAGLEYAGGSIVVGPKGEVLGELGPVEDVLSVEVDAARVREWRGAFPAWKDARLP
ncbi:omega-amidase [Phycisphaerales bacterium]|nr:omega-amidase [Phycisphaerales bacterium]